MLLELDGLEGADFYVKMRLQMVSAAKESTIHKHSI